MESVSRTERKKDERREKIIMAAEGLFLEKGFQNTTMNALAERADFTKKTVYSYFSSKEDLYYAVVSRWYETLLEEVKRVVGEEGSAFDRIVRGCRGYTDLYRQNPVIFYLMNSLESVRVAGTDQELPGRQRLMATKTELFALMFSLFDAAKKEGNVRTDIETTELVASFIFNLTGFFYILSSNGRNFTRYFSLDETRFIDSSVRLIIDGIGV